MTASKPIFMASLYNNSLLIFYYGPFGGHNFITYLFDFIAPIFVIRGRINPFPSLTFGQGYPWRASIPKVYRTRRQGDVTERGREGWAFYIINRGPDWQNLVQLPLGTWLNKKGVYNKEIMAIIN